MVRDDAQSVALRLGADSCRERVVGAGPMRWTPSRKRVQHQRARGLGQRRNKPVGVFLLCGPSGVGKTETALALAEALYGGEQNLDLDQHVASSRKSHTVSTLKGAPPGYVGYGEGWRADRGGAGGRPYSA
jgi:type VI secretion system protein VasG